MINLIDPSGHDPLILIGAAVGFLGDIGYQLATNGGNISCIDWKQVAMATGAGALIGAVGPAALEGGFWDGLAADEGGALKVGQRFTPNQEALVDLAKDAQRSGITPSEADTLGDWADEYGLNYRNDIGENHWVGGDHVHLGPINHIPVR